MSDQVYDKNSKKNVIIFSLLMSFICSLLITAAASGLKGFQQENIKLDKKINILKAANLLDITKKLPKNKIKQLYASHIEEIIVNKNGEIINTAISDSMHLYFYKTKDIINGYILPINTRGLWGKIQGYLAFENDGQTVSGFSVFSHSETPGLGGEIEASWFQGNFKGKKILNSKDKFVSVGIARGKVKNMPEKLKEHYVDGISGATLTGQYLSQGIKTTLIKYEPVSIKFRQKRLKAIDQEKDKK